MPRIKRKVSKKLSSQPGKMKTKKRSSRANQISKKRSGSDGPKVQNTDETRKPSSVCEMKAFDAFGSDSDAVNSSGSDSCLSSGLYDSLKTDLEKEQEKNECEKAPQCVGPRKFKSNGDGDDDVDEIQFSFEPYYRFGDPNSFDQWELSDSDTDSEKSMYLSRRMSIKLTRSNQSPLRSTIKARRLIFSSSGITSKLKSRRKEVKIAKRYGRKR